MSNLHTFTNKMSNIINSSFKTVQIKYNLAKSPIKFTLHIVSTIAALKTSPSSLNQYKTQQFPFIKQTLQIFLKKNSNFPFQRIFFPIFGALIIEV